MELLHFVDVRMEEVSRPLCEEVAALKLLLARVGESLELTGGLGLAPVQALLPLDSTERKSSVLPLELGSFEALATLTPQSPTSLVSGAVVELSSDAFFLLKSFAACSPVWRRLALDMARILTVS
jgi:hypothetical protein